jgi:threonine dehydratase
MKFVPSMGPNWNINFFHYRNNGTDYGGILLEIQVSGQFPLTSSPA